MGHAKKASTETGRASDLGLIVCRLSEFKKNGLHSWLNKPTVLDSYVNFVVTRGVGKIQIDFESYDLEIGTLVYLSRGQHAQFVQSGNIDAVVFIASQSFLDELFDGRGLHPFLKLFSYHQFSPLICFTEEQYPELIKRFEDVYQEYQNTDLFGYKQVLQLMMKLLMFQVVRMRNIRFQGSEEPRSVKMFSDFSSQVIEHYRTVKSAREYARMLKVSYKTLNQVCKANINMTAKAYIEYYSVLEMKRDLAYSTRSIQEIAYAFGYNEPSNMVKFFKKHTHNTPTQFRSQFH